MLDAASGGYPFRSGKGGDRDLLDAGRRLDLGRDLAETSRFQRILTASEVYSTTAGHSPVDIKNRWQRRKGIENHAHLW
jgi:hypothetical protein